VGRKVEAGRNPGPSIQQDERKPKIMRKTIGAKPSVQDHQRKTIMEKPMNPSRPTRETGSDPNQEAGSCPSQKMGSHEQS
jgi:hypothetical protein